jgi:hypothetical protein
MIIYSKCVFILLPSTEMSDVSRTCNKTGSVRIT